MADKKGPDPRIEAAFHEVKHDVPAIVKHTARTEGAKQAHRQSVAIALSKARKAGADVPGASGANYVSRDELFIPEGARTSGWKRGGSTVPYKIAPHEGEGTPTGKLGTTATLYTSEGLATHKSSGVPTAECISVGKQIDALEGVQTNLGGDLQSLRPVNRVMNPIEAIRKRNNAVRDARTNLGRGKPGNVVANADDRVDGSGSW